MYAAYTSERSDKLAIAFACSELIACHGMAGMRIGAIYSALYVYT